ncbi:hypothetical protein ADUPG1_005337 [Aduncisulcus paluster]|uniref:Uncharacterized protein n=1 Tax=Aduncisulcus paluster TaxID=2918883 RepID=A0ABQ5KF45_9EUKA|nr:hypothetical protein ADUPG1_005337 [Aduncisulcus paluster]
MGSDIKVRVDGLQVITEGFNFVGADLFHEIELTVEVGFLDAVKVGNDKLLEPTADKMHGAVGPQSSSSGNADADRLQVTQTVPTEIFCYALLCAVHDASCKGCQSLNTGW